VLVLQAAGLLVGLKLSLRVIGFGRTSELLARGFPLEHRRPNATVVERVRRRLDETARALPFTISCLPTSMALWALLRRRGVETEIRIGVRLDPDGLAAHAWVERDGSPLNDSDDVVVQYPPFDRAVSHSLLASMD